MRHLIDRAVRIAIAERRVTALILPNDLQERAYEEPPRNARHACIPASAMPAPKIVPYEADLRRAADVLNAGKKVAILVGAGALQRDRRGDRGGRDGSAPASPRRCSARPRCRTICPGSPARSACSAPSRAGS